MAEEEYFSDSSGEEVQIWEVCGGADKGGIMVRTGRSTTSTPFKERLAHGSRVRQIEVLSGRLLYQLVAGTGPESGWVSTQLKDKDLLVPIDNPWSSALRGAPAPSDQEMEIERAVLEQHLKANDGHNPVDSSSLEALVAKIASVPEFMEISSMRKLDLMRQQLTCLPDRLCRFTQLEILDAMCNSLERLPQGLGDLSALTDLDFTENRLVELPGSIGQLMDLKELKISKNRLHELPESIGELSSLVRLSAMYNRLEVLPESFGQLLKLEILNLQKNWLSFLPESLGELVQLRTFDISQNKLASLPESIGKLRALQRLQLSENCLRELPDSFGCLCSLETLDLAKNSLSRLPASFGQLGALGDMNLSHNSVRNLPESFGQLRRLWRFMATSNLLDVLPDTFSELMDLQTLSLQDNPLAGPVHKKSMVHPLDRHPARLALCVLHRLGSLRAVQMWQAQSTELPDLFRGLVNSAEIDLQRFLLRKFPLALCGIEEVRSLLLGRNLLRRLPDTFLRFVHMQKLDLENNKLEELPEDFGQLVALTWLSVAHNGLTHLPESLGEMQQLVWLNVGHNILGSLPDDFGRLRSLKDCDLSYNKLVDLPESFDDMNGVVSIGLEGTPLAESLAGPGPIWEQKLLYIMSKYDALRRLKIRDNQGDALPPEIHSWNNGMKRPPPRLKTPHPGRNKKRPPKSASATAEKCAETETIGALEATMNTDERYRQICQDLEMQLDLANEAQDRQQLLKNFYREWHPDKRLDEPVLATKIFQWLQMQK